MIIDTDNYAAAGIETFTFAGGEHHCKVPKMPIRVVHIHAKIRSAYDWATLKVVCDALQRELHEVYLFLPYLPGARQDRVTSVGSPLTCEIFARELEQMVHHVTVFDIHSKAAEDIMLKVLTRRRFTAKRPHWLVPALIPAELRPDFVIAPDKGARDRAMNAAYALGQVPVLNCTKERDPATGNLSKFMIPKLPLPESLDDDPFRYLIVDDICDGGGTFVGLLEAFREESDDPVDLWVTHGIFSKGFAPLNGFDNVYTTDSFYQSSTGPGSIRIPPPKIHTLSLLPYYLEGLTP